MIYNGFQDSTGPTRMFDDAKKLGRGERRMCVQNEPERLDEFSYSQRINDVKSVSERLSSSIQDIESVNVQ